jgi:hypothetical protein
MSIVCCGFQGWLVDLINKFGCLKGFQILLERFQRNLSVSLIAALIRLVVLLRLLVIVKETNYNDILIDDVPINKVNGQLKYLLVIILYATVS